MKKVRSRRRPLAIEALDSRRLLAAHISELLVDPLFGDKDTTQMVELRGQPNATLQQGTYLLVVSERGLNKGEIHGKFDLSGQQFGSNGYLVMLQKDSPHVADPAANTLVSTETGFGGLPADLYSDTHDLSERIDFIIGANAYILVQTGNEPTLGTDIDTNDDGVIDPAIAATWQIHDSISLHPFVGRGDLAYGNIVYAEIGTGLTAINAPQATAVIGTEGFGYAGRVGESSRSLPEDWVVGTVQNEAAAGDPARWALADNLFGEPSQFPYAGRDLDHVGGPNFVGGVRGTIRGEINQGIANVTVLADTNGNGQQDNLHFVVDPDDVSTPTNTGVPLLNAFDGATVTNFALGSFAAHEVTAEREKDFPNERTNRIFAKGGIDWFENSNVLRIDFYRPVNRASIVAIGDDNPLSKVYGRLQAYTVDGQLIDETVSGLLVDSARQTIEVSSGEDNIAYVFAFADNDYPVDTKEGGPFGRFDRLEYWQHEPTAVTDENGDYDIRHLFPGQYNVQLLDENWVSSIQPINVQQYENFVFDFTAGPNQPPAIDSAEFAVSEGSVAGTVVGTVTASDPNGDSITFALGGTQDEFAIDAVSGQITVTENAEFNFETQQQFELVVVATDSRGAASDRTVIVNVTDANEPPSLGDATAFVAEDQPVGTVVRELFAQDPDADTVFQYSIVGGNDAGLFEVEASTGKLLVAQPLDFETVSRVDLQVRVTDNGQPALFDDATVTVFVADVNEAPQLTTTLVEIPENKTGILAMLSASDPESGQGAAFEAIGGTAVDMVTLFSSGLLSLNDNARLDYESENQYTLDVRVTDTGNPPRSTEATIELVIQDVNEPPKFDLELTPPAAVAGEPYRFELPDGYASDPENDPWQLQIDLESAGMSRWVQYDAATGVIDGILPSSLIGPHEINVRLISQNDPELFTDETVSVVVGAGQRPLQNQVTRHDVNADEDVTAFDALQIINFLSRHGQLLGADATVRFGGFYDVNGDNDVTSFDALWVINELARGGESESPAGELMAVGGNVMADIDEDDLDAVFAEPSFLF
ncbi:cadherin domain-containing protein [Crateriforma spongiae]|uniref:cadherin domain-containing protein n=1 Tax=Crateriforma spongiae TaxID=2724528 RepID=UPI001445243F|nr:cadherin domain-containing protein [Crateriforma spongiae]